jgi:hypothetical protein
MFFHAEYSLHSLIKTHTLQEEEEEEEEEAALHPSFY